MPTPQKKIVPLTPFLIEPVVRLALAEDLGRSGDLTTDLIISPEARGKARINARKSGVISGLGLVELTYRCLDSQVKVTPFVSDGTEVEAKDCLMEIEGPLRSILTGERVGLNFVGHMSGIANETHTIVQAVEGTRARVCCTRKTTPGLRAIEKYAVRCGGGYNHRLGLDDAVLIKDNHVAASGSLTQAIASVRAGIGHMVKIEVEVDNLDQFQELLEAGIDVALLDNMSVEDMAKAVESNQGRAILEASGGITIETAKNIADTGVDILSLGWLTHSAPNFDVGLDFD
jgi:nicotinate-nucleotide pyrophosphorylase (carboxylating)